ncbi:MAG: hypothetical protein M3Y56_08325 [Armatimonadota bacterium]|nr:hypothetical protein [Armatimonadota bacterium]
MIGCADCPTAEAVPCEICGLPVCDGCAWLVEFPPSWKRAGGDLSHICLGCVPHIRPVLGRRAGDERRIRP